MTWSTSRASVHSAAEWLLAGPQYVERGTIRLRVEDDGIATTDGQRLLNGDGLAVRTQDRDVTVPWAKTIQEMANAAGIKPSVPTDVYDGHSPLGLDDELLIDPTDLRKLLQWFVLGRDAIEGFAIDQTPVLWPEHFDLSITASEVNYGVSPGDGFYDSCYAYVGPWTTRDGDFWNAPFGAFRPADEILDVDSLGAFFSEGAAIAADQDR